MRRIWIATVVLAFVAVLAIPARALEVGDMAPALSIAEWIQGKPVDLQKDRDAQVFMVEFWATWCPPCKASVPRLNDFQKKFTGDLTIIGVTSEDDRGNTTSSVKRFVKQQGSNMSYHVAMDKDLGTSSAYMGSAQVMGIPYAFLVARGGRVAWHGSPLDPSLDEVIASVVSGQFDFDAAKVAGQVEQRFQALNPLVQMGQWSAVWDGLIGILKLDPANETALELILAVHVERGQKPSTYREWASDHIKAHRDNIKAMQRLAAILCDNPNLESRFPDLALEAAKAAYEGSNRRDPLAIVTYARALYQIGELDRAIELQTDAVAVAVDPREFQAVLEYYNLCKQLRGT